MIAKVESETEAHRLAARHGVEVVVLCPSGVLGPYDHGLTPSSALIADLKNGAGPPGAGGTSWVDARDVARGHRLAAEKGRAGERYILADDLVSNAECARFLSEIAGRRVWYLPVPRFVALPTVARLERVARLRGMTPGVTSDWARAAASRRFWYDVSKAERELGWTHRDMRAVLRDAARWLAFTGRLRPEVAARVLADAPPDPEWLAPAARPPSR